MARGFTLIEVAVLLSVLSVLGALVVGTAGNLLERARFIEAQESVEEIGRAIVEFYSDNGFFPKTVDLIGGRPGSQAIGVLASDGELPQATAAAAWWVQSRTDRLLSHLFVNERGYTPFVPGAATGWKGPYLGRPVGADPWGSAYLINVFYLDAQVAVRDLDGTDFGASFVLSGGPNGTIETPYFQPRQAAGLFGDDIGFRLR